ncbi:MAG: SpoIIE family protein phosphatase [Candidatus Krumholzibacteria bacterium]|nr:SpoIIE family protein phosphatase [Candidatus Krumholzibacteria bacterium]
MIRFIRWCLICGALLITVLDIAGGLAFPDSAFTGIRHSNLVFREFKRDSPNAGIPLERGDRILAVDGRAARNINHFRFLVESADSGAVQTYVFARGDSLFEAGIKSVPQPMRNIHRRITLSLTAFTFIFLGMTVLLRRPDILGQLFTVNCLVIAFLLTTRPVTDVEFLHLAGELVYDFLTVFFPAFFLHFFLLFPGKEIESGTRRSRIRTVLYLPPAILFIALFGAAMMSYSVGVRPAVLQVLNGVTSIYWLLYVIGSVVLFVRTYVTSDRIQRGKFRIAAVGLVIGVLPFLTVMLLRQFLPSVRIQEEHVSVIFLSFISASFALAILRYDAFDMRFVYRTGVAFVIATAILAATIYIFSGTVVDRIPGVLDARLYSLFFLAAAVFFAALSPTGDSLRRIADRLLGRNRELFREQVMDFSRRIHSLKATDEIASFVSSALREFFDARSVHVFLGGAGSFVVCGGSPERGGLPLTSLAAGADLVTMAQSRTLPMMIEYYDGIWISSNLDRTSREFLSLSGAAVIVPLVEQGELLGFILLGRKRSGKPYTASDAELLELLGERSAASVRSSMLYRVSAEKERLEEEVHLASEIQRRLLPSAPPRLAGAELLGDMRTSREVGGDFFDYLELAPGVVGIAVADVSGKGVPASILMTTLQAAFRAEVSVERSPAQVLQSLNRTLYDRSDECRFATFFYAIYDDRTRIMRYCNGGAFPPIVLRDDGMLMRLLCGGTLIGVDPDTGYREGIFKMRPGDLLVIYTDGFIDQENSSGEYFGEERILSFLRLHRNLSVSALFDKLFETVLGFGAGSIKDDMTLVALRILDES